MKTSECDHLDGYLCGWLSEDEAAGFAAHLADCPACADQIERQGQVDRLLARGAGQLEPVPSRLIDRIEGRIRSLRRRRVIRLACSLSAAVLVVLCLGAWFAAEHLGRSSKGPRPMARPPEPPPAQEQVVPPFQFASNAEPADHVAIGDPSEAIMVLLRTESPNVSIVWVYPTAKPASAVAGPAAARSP